MLIETLDGLDLPKPIKSLGKAALKQLDENKIDSILVGTLDFLANAYAKIEAIQDTVDRDDLISTDSETMIVTTLENTAERNALR
ncbi:MAG TPA: hypothetical protein VGO47_14805 [Chlamydiales bacterium]|nr:hypothetical protein [Chlamydiales bacterium]